MKHLKELESDPLALQIQFLLQLQLLLSFYSPTRHNYSTHLGSGYIILCFTILRFHSVDKERIALHFFMFCLFALFVSRSNGCQVLFIFHKMVVRLQFKFKYSVSPIINDITTYNSHKILYDLLILWLQLKERTQFERLFFLCYRFVYLVLFGCRFASYDFQITVYFNFFHSNTPAFALVFGLCSRCMSSIFFYFDGADRD